jgi:hypothetical protein
LLEEYKLLSEHVRHEDSELKKTLAMFLTLNLGLMGFATSKFAEGDLDTRWIVPVAGVLLWLPWIPSMVRIRAFRNYLEARIARIEDQLQQYWVGQAPPAGAPGTGDRNFRILDIRSFESGQIDRIMWPPRGFSRWLHESFGNWPTSLTYLFLPCSFLVIWLILVAMRLNGWAALAAGTLVLVLYGGPALWNWNKKRRNQA